MECLGVLEGHSKWVLSVSVDFKTQRALSGSGDDTLRVWDLEAMACIGSVSSDEAAILAVSVNSDSGPTQAVGGLRNGKICVWDLETMTRTAVLTGHGEGTLVWAVSAGFGSVATVARKAE